MFLKVIACPICGHRSAPEQLNELKWEKAVRAASADPAAAAATKVMRRYQCWNCLSHFRTEEVYEPEPYRARWRERPELAFVPLTLRPEGAILEQRRCIDPSGKPMYEDPEYGRPCPCPRKPCERADPTSRRVTLDA